MVRADTWKINEVANKLKIGTTHDILNNVKINEVVKNLEK
jgi:hypothetical protein